MNTSTLTSAGLDALGTALYVLLVASFFHFIPRLLGEVKEPAFLIPVAMLLLLVLSASITGSLVLGRPILWYLDGKKKEAVSLFVATLGFLFLLTILAFTGIALFA